MSVTIVVDRCPIEKVTMAFKLAGEAVAHCLHAELTLPARYLQPLIVNRVASLRRFSRNRGSTRLRIASHQSEENAYKQ